MTTFYRLVIGVGFFCLALSPLNPITLLWEGNWVPLLLEVIAVLVMKIRMLQAQIKHAETFQRKLAYERFQQTGTPLTQPEIIEGSEEDTDVVSHGIGQLLESGEFEQMFTPEEDNSVCEELAGNTQLIQEGGRP